METVCCVCLKIGLPTVMCQECKRICYCSEKCRREDNGRHEHGSKPTQADDTFVKEREKEMGNKIMESEDIIFKAANILTEGLLYMDLSDGWNLNILSANFDASVKEKIKSFTTKHNLIDTAAMAYRVIMKDIVFEGVLYVVKNSSQIIIHGEKYYINEQIFEIREEMQAMLDKMLNKSI